MRTGESACVRTDYRNTAVLHMPWKGIVRYALSSKARYSLGCSSLGSRDEAEGMALYEQLEEEYLIEPAPRTKPWPEFRCRMENEARTPLATLRLFRAYLDVSTRLCGPPAIDREFKIIDFLKLIDFEHIPDRLRTLLFQPFLSAVLGALFFAQQHLLCQCQGFRSLRGILELAAGEIARAAAFAA